MPAPPDVCRAWFGSAAVTGRPFGPSGFSGSRLFIVERAVPSAGSTGTDRFVLKSLPGGATDGRAAWVHALMRHLRAEGIVQVPEVIATPDGETLVVDDVGMPWELVGFMPGAAVEWPTDGQAAAGMELLATLHVTACRLAGGWPRPAVSPGHRRRIEQARRLLDDPWPSRRGRLSGNGADNGPGGDRHRAEIVARLDAAIARFAAADGRLALRAVAACCAEPLPLQPVLRDVSGEHVLYDTHARGPAAAQAPTAIVDYHAAGIDTPATDIARLLGSWRRPVDRGRLSLTDAWPEAIAAYERVRPLDDRERRLVPFLHATAVVLGLDNWLRWTLDERRHFADPARVVARIDRLLAELEDAIAQTIDAAANLD